MFAEVVWNPPFVGHSPAALYSPAMPILKMTKGPSKPRKLEFDERFQGDRWSLSAPGATPDERISRQHFLIERRGGRWEITDLNSTAGTFLNSVRLLANRPTPIRFFDQVSVCDYIWQFRPSETDPIYQSDDTAGPGDGGLLRLGKKGLEESSSIQTIASPDRKLVMLLTLLEELRGNAGIAARLERVVGRLKDHFTQTHLGRLVLKRNPANPDGIDIRLPAQIACSELDVHVHDRLFEQRLTARTPDLLQVFVPLIDHHEHTLGYLHFSSRRPWTDPDVDLFIAAARMISFAIETELFRKVEEEIQKTQAVQRVLLPEEVPAVPGYDLFGGYKPSRMVGGDYYDFIELTDGRIILALADVSGKDLPAGMMMAKVAGLIRGFLTGGWDLVQVVSRVNRDLCKQVERQVTLLLVEFDPQTHKLRCVNAGHPYPLRRSASGQISELGAASQGLLLGAYADWEYVAYDIELAPGDMLFMYSDGVTDAISPAGEHFGDARLRDYVRQNALAPKAWVSGLLATLENFTGEALQFDDITLVCLKRN